MKLVVYLVHCLLLWCFFCEAEETTQLKPLVFSYVSHPIVELQLKPMITEAYRNLGYEVRFVDMQSDRFIQQFESVEKIIVGIASLPQLEGIIKACSNYASLRVPNDFCSDDIKLINPAQWSL